MLGYRETLQQKISRIKHSAYSGAAISQHHSLRRAHFSIGLFLSIVLIPVIMDYLLIHFNPLIAELWQALFRFWMKRLDIPGTTGLLGFQLFGIDISVPYPDVLGQAPSDLIWWISYIIILILFYLTFCFKENYLPSAYFLRLLLFIIFTTNIYFIFHPNFIYQTGGLIGGNLLLSYKLLLMAPWIMALTYNIFDFSFLKKFWLNAIILLYLIIFLPFQYVLHSWIIAKTSLLFLPVLYLIFGSLLDILMFIAIYSWGLSWKNRKYSSANK